MLRLISQFAVEQSDVEAGHDDVFETCESPRKKMKSKKSSMEKIFIPRLTQVRRRQVFYYSDVNNYSKFFVLRLYL